MMARVNDIAKQLCEQLQALGLPVEMVHAKTNPPGQEIVFTITVTPEPEPLTHDDYVAKLRSVVHEWAEMVKEWIDVGIVDDNEKVRSAIAVSRKLVAMDPGLLRAIESLSKIRCYCSAMPGGGECDRCSELKHLRHKLSNPPRVVV